MNRTELNKDKQTEIEHEKRNSAIKKIIKRIVYSLIIIFFVTFFSLLYIVKIGTTNIIVNEKAIINEKIPDSFTGLKIIQFSDLHYDDINILKNTVKLINRRNPDIILFTGDLLKKEKISLEEKEILVKELKKLKSTLGKYAVIGESDNEEALNILNNCDFIVLNDSNDLIYDESNNPIMLVGLNTNHSPNYQQAFTNYNQNIFTITMFHKPDYIDEFIKTYPSDLALAGHSHLGEIRIPSLINMASFKKASKYINSYYEINNTKFYISSGLGTIKYPVRINARPSINFFRLRKTAS